MREAQKTAIVYVRTSTGGQRDAGTIASQIRTCSKLVADHRLKLLPYGPANDGWLKDDGISGATLEGRSLKTLLEDLIEDRIKVDYLVVPSYSRLSREERVTRNRAKAIKSGMDAKYIQLILANCNVKVIDDTGVIEGGLLATVKGEVSAEEYAAIKKRTMAGKARHLSQGSRATGGRVPWGYERVPIDGDRKKGTTLGVHPEDGPRAIQMWRWYVEGGAASAARQCEAAGWPAPRGGKHWYPSTVQQMLRNVDALRGEATLTIDGESYTLTYPPLLDADLYMAVKRREKEATKQPRQTLLTTGYLTCACGDHARASSSNATGAYILRCRTKCGSILSDTMQAALWEALVCRYVQLSETGSNKKADTGIDARIAEARAKLAKVEKQLAGC